MASLNCGQATHPQQYKRIPKSASVAKRSLGCSRGWLDATTADPFFVTPEPSQCAVSRTLLLSPHGTSGSARAEHCPQRPLRYRAASSGGRPRRPRPHPAHSLVPSAGAALTAPARHRRRAEAPGSSPGHLLSRGALVTSCRRPCSASVSYVRLWLYSTSSCVWWLMGRLRTAPVDGSRAARRRVAGSTFFPAASGKT